jgi:type II secretory pathway component PulF
MGFKLEPTIQPKQKQSSFNLDELLKKEISFFGTFFNNKRKASFFTELGVLLKAGVRLREGLQLLSENQKKEKMISFYSGMVDDLDAGKSFYEVLKSKKEFNEYEAYSVQIGEETGNLPGIITELGNFCTQKNEQRRQLLNAMAYPIIILCTAILVVVFMLRMVVPMFEDIFRQNGVELPTITKWIIAASNAIKTFGLPALLVLTGMIIFRKSLFGNKLIKEKWQAFLLKLPFAGNFIRLVHLSQFTQAMALLTSSKVPMLNSIQMVGRMVGFYPLKSALVRIEEQILSGMSLHESVKGKRVFDLKMTALIKVAEETNEIEYIFEKLNQQYADEVRQKSKLLSTLMEPLIIVVIGLFVGVILVSMYLPMFKLSSVLG